LEVPIIRGVVRHSPTIDFQGIEGVIPQGTPDAEVLRIAAELGRVLVSRDTSTMIVHFREFTSKNNSPGLILIPSSVKIGEAVRRLRRAWARWNAESMRNQVRWLTGLR
jgi:hypothetical protein